MIRRGSAILIGHGSSSQLTQRHRNLYHALITGVIRKITGNCRGQLRVRNVNCQTRMRNHGLGLDLKCDRPMIFRPPTKVRFTIRGGAGIVVDNVSGRLINGVTTDVQTDHPPRPCGNGNIHCTKRRIQHGTKGSNGGWTVGTDHGRLARHHRTHVHQHIFNAARQPHLTMFHSGRRVCTRVVSSATRRALITTSAIRSRILSGSTSNTARRTTTTINGTMTRQTLGTKVARIMFSQNNGLCRNQMTTLTRTTQRTNLDLWP